MKKFLFVCWCASVLASCKTYEQYGGVTWNNAFEPVDKNYPVDVFAVSNSADSAMLVIKLLGSEKTKSAKWSDSIKFTFTVLTDSTGGDKFMFNDSSIRIAPRTVSTANDQTVTVNFSLKQHVPWMQVNVRTSEFNVLRMVDLPTQNMLPPALTDSAGSLVNPAFLHVNSSYRFVNASFNSVYKAQHYSFPRSPAAPVYRNEDYNNLHPLADTTMLMNTAGGLQFSESGVYRLSDTVAHRSFVVTVHDGNFPDIKSARELVLPLRYITRNEEYNPMLTTANQRQRVDSFWISKSKSEVVARKSIRVYYNRVRAANRMFTTSLPGWMSDRGIVLIMYGEPDRSFKFKQGEIWSYSKNFSRNLEFVFVRGESFLGFDYALKRNAEYMQSWNQQSFKWRSGGILYDEPQLY